MPRNPNPDVFGIESQARHDINRPFQRNLSRLDLRKQFDHLREHAPVGECGVAIAAARLFQMAGQAKLRLAVEERHRPHLLQVEPKAIIPRNAVFGCRSVSMEDHSLLLPTFLAGGSTSAGELFAFLLLGEAALFGRGRDLPAALQRFAPLANLLD